mgnify:FL=1
MGIGAKLGVFSVTGATVASSFTNAKSIAFDGSDDYVEGSAEFNSLDGATQSSFMFWFKTQATSLQYVASQWAESNNDNRNLRIQITPSTPRIDVYLGHNIAFRSSTSISTDAWHHLAVTYNGGNAGSSRVKVYLDGSAATNVGFSGPTSMKANPASAFSIGRRTGYAFNEFNGNIDEVSIFDAELTSGQVSTYYNSGVPTDLNGQSNLIHWWRMGDGDTYATLTDNAGSYDLTMNNMASDDIEDDVPS